MRILILEDCTEERIPHFRMKLTQKPDVTLLFAETAIEAIRALEYGEAMPEKAFDLIFLDHDLGGKQFVDPSDKNTGSEVVRWMQQHLTRYCPVIVHTLNPGCGESMMLSLGNIGMEVHRIPWDVLAKKLEDPNFIT